MVAVNGTMSCNGTHHASGVRRVGVIGGAGHVGFPLSLMLADRGFEVVVVDLDVSKMEKIKKGEFPFLEKGGPELLARCLEKFPERLIFTNSAADVRDCDIIVLTIGTPVDEHLNPEFKGIEACIKSLLPYLSDSQTLLLRSTLFPGSSNRILAMLHAANCNVGVSFCPERIAQGYALDELVELPQIVSASDDVALARAKAMFEPFGVDLLELDLQEAELAKLFLNSWRYVVFGIANQFYQIATSKGLNFNKIFGAITYKYRRSGGFPRPGFSAGPCLFKDTMQLAAYCRHTFSLGHAAMLVNETMPDCVVEQAKKEVLRQGLTMAGMKCGILGMAFKPGNDDFRESLAYKLRRLLHWEGAEVLCTDVYIKQEGFVELQDMLDQSKVVLVGCPHSEYKDIKFREDQIVVDCWFSTSAATNQLNITAAPAECSSEQTALAAPSGLPKVAIIGGAGHVGLPFSLVLAEKGFTVVIVDLDQAKLDSIAKGNFPFLEKGGAELLAKILAEHPDRLIFTTDYGQVQDCNIIIVTIGTPVDEHLNPQFSGAEACINRLKPSLHSGQTLVLRSTLFPGSSARIASMLKQAGLEDVGVSFCPERIAQGYALEELTELPQIVSASTETALQQAKSLFAPLGVDLIELELQEAEVAKLFLNSWRYVVFGTANQFYQIAMAKELDFYKIHSAITHKYRRAGGFPRPGFSAGPCLFKDTMQLAAYCRHGFSLGHNAMLVNETMPDCVLEQAKKELSRRGLEIAGTTCGVLGMAFKPDNDDHRESLAYKLRRLLLWENAEVLCTDVYIKQEGFVELEDMLSKSKVILVGCPHKEYKGISFRDDQIVIDCWGSVPRTSSLKLLNGEKAGSNGYKA
jgi:UDP-N-acetyl-D-mannosaminuronic acid dehydrogenase